MNEEEIKNKLTPEEYKVLREKGTEAPFSGELLNEKREGMYKCKVCGQQLFSSDTKFESGTGWPSFDEALPGAVEFVDDDSHGVHRAEVVCSKCRSHLGHIFDDLPAGRQVVRQDGKPVSKRYCMNSVCLEFETPRDSDTLEGTINK